MKSQIIQIGNSQGIRIPKVLLEESGLKGDVDLEIHAEGVLIRNIQKPRAGWDEAFKAMAENDDDELVGTGSSAAFDKKEWQW
ncbi:MAG: AbrB/MazE/SpoVT family DNA-binding domain-containing protein [Acidobacteriota bacterium]